MTSGASLIGSCSATRPSVPVSHPPPGDGRAPAVSRFGAVSCPGLRGGDVPVRRVCGKVVAFELWALYPARFAGFFAGARFAGFFAAARFASERSSPRAS